MRWGRRAPPVPAAAGVNLLRFPRPRRGRGTGGGRGEDCGRKRRGKKDQAADRPGAEQARAPTRRRRGRRSTAPEERPKGRRGGNVGPRPPPFGRWPDRGAAGAAANAQERTARASRERAQRRARVAVRDLGLCNDWEYFVTLTLDPARINRYDPAEVVRHLNHWLDNRVRRDGLCYVLVPEHHRDGAIHFHGFFNGALAAVDSGHKDDGGHPIYNLPAWGWGFSTAIRLYGERAAAVGYCCKYIAKQQEKIGGRWYYSGGALRRPEVSWSDVDFEALLQEEGAEPFQIEALPWNQFLRLRTSPLQDSCEGTREG